MKLTLAALFAILTVSLFAETKPAAPLTPGHARIGETKAQALAHYPKSADAMTFVKDGVTASLNFTAAGVSMANYIAVGKALTPAQINELLAANGANWQQTMNKPEAKMWQCKTARAVSDGKSLSITKQ